MKNYSRVEYRLSDVLTSFPRLKKIAKKSVSAVNYLLHGDRKFMLSLHENCNLIDFLSSARYPEDELFYGYYATSPWNSSQEYLLLNKKSKKGGFIEIIVVDKAGNYKVVAESNAWNYQQGALAQWIKIDGEEGIIFNDFADGILLSKIIDRVGNEKATFQYPIQACDNHNKLISINYCRLDKLRPEYGYGKNAINFNDRMEYQKDGIWMGTIPSGKFKLLISLKELFENLPRNEMLDSEHKVNHVFISPNGNKILFYHRWISPRAGKFSRLYVYDINKKNLKLLLDEKIVSHFCWKGNETILVFAKYKNLIDYYLIKTETGEINTFAGGKLAMYGDGHPSFSPNGNWLITDSYPDKSRKSRLILFNVESKIIYEIGIFKSPLRFEGTHRCDLHPRWSPDGRMISFDSAHDGARMSYIMDVSRLI